MTENTSAQKIHFSPGTWSADRHLGVSFAAVCGGII